MIKTIRNSIAVAALLVVFSCEMPTDPGDTNTPGGTGDPGNTGGSAEYTLEDHTLTLPAGLSITGITADDSQNLDIVLLAQGAFLLNVTVVNSTVNDIALDFDAGWVFLADNDTVQDMCIIQDRSVTIVPGSNTVYVPVYCIDPLKTEPAPADTYQLGATITNTGILEVINICSTKVIDMLSFAQVQTIVFDCINTGSLSSANRTYLNGLTDI